MTQVAAEPFSEVGVSLCPPVDDLSFSNKAPGDPLHLWHKVALLVARSWRSTKMEREGIFWSPVLLQLSRT